MNLRAHIVGEVKDSAPAPAVHQMDQGPERVAVPEAKTPRSGMAILALGSILGAFWAGAACAYLLGYFGAQGLTRLDPQLISFSAVITFLPPLLVIASAYALARAQTLSDTARHLANVSDRLTATDENAVQSAQRLGRAVRRELDALSAGLDGAFGRMRALETALHDRLAQLEEAGARAAVRAEGIAQRLHSEREGIEELATRLDETSARAAENLAGRSAQLKSIIEAAATELKAAGQTLDVQVGQFRDAAEMAANAPQAAAVELDRQAKQIETAGEAAAARAEFVLARQERQRIAMNELVNRFKQESDAFQAVLDAQRDAAEQAAAALAGQAQLIDRASEEGVRRIDSALGQAASNLSTHISRIEEIAIGGIHRLDSTISESTANITGIAISGIQRLDSTISETAANITGHAKRIEDVAVESTRRLDSAMTETAARSAQLASGFNRDADMVKQTSDAVAARISRLVEVLREATNNAKALIEDSTEEAKRKSVDYVGDAMDQCNQLLKAAATVAEEADKARAVLARAAEEAERHIVKLPGVAAQEAQRVREMVRAETEQMLDISARAITTLQSRSAPKRHKEEPAAQAVPEAEAPEPQSEGLIGLARRITQPRRRSEDRPTERGGERNKSYQLSEVLAAAEAGSKQSAKSGFSATLASLQSALADIASDLDMLGGESSDPALWRRYLDGDRGVFARKLAGSIGPESVDRISALYRDNARFHEAADSYIAEFEGMLTRAREGDKDGFLASTLLTADTGKIYLTVAYALGRLES